MSVGLEKCPKTCKLCSELAQLNNVDRDCIEDQATDTPSVDDPVYKQSCASLKAAGMCSKIGDAQDEVRRHLRFLPRAGGRCERQGPMRQAQLVPVEGRPLHPVPVLAHVQDQAGLKQLRQVHVAAGQDPVGREAETMQICDNKKGN